MSDVEVTVEAGRCIVSAERGPQGRTATARVATAGGGEPDDDVRHLAGASAWLAAAEGLVADDPEEALASARSGIDELGSSYLDPMAVDDTKMKLYAADDLEDEGRTADAARLVASILSQRISRFLSAHDGVEPLQA